MASTDTVTSFFGERRRRAQPPAVPLVSELSDDEAALVAEACGKTSIVWVRPLGMEQFSLAWHAWHDGAVHVVYGVGEQMLPLLNGSVVLCVRSKDTGARLLTVLARADVLAAGSAEWEAAARALSAARLNALDPATQLQRWAAGTIISRLTPVRMLASGPGGDATPSEATPPPRGPATTIGRRPWHLGGRARGRRGSPP